jgi:flagellar protein FlaG
MDIGGVRMAPAAATIPAANRVEPTSNGTRAVATELPKSEAVRALPDATQVRVDVNRDRNRDQAAREQLLRDFIQKRNVVDPRTREVVYRAVDTRTGDVVRQFPDEARLKLREYLNLMRDAAGDGTLTGDAVQRSA